MDKKIAKRIAIALCGVALTGVGATSIIKENTYTASANDAGTKEWLQYGTLKYDLRGPSGRIYRAGTKVVREAGTNEKPAFSVPKGPFYLTMQIGGLPGNNLIQDTGGGYIAESYVNISGDWTEIDYPTTTTVLVNNTTDYTDLKSSDFHPVDSSNPDVPHANVDALRKAYSDPNLQISNKSTPDDIKLMNEITDRYMAAVGIGATQDEVDQLTKDINSAIANYKKTGHLAGTNIADKPIDNTTTAKKPTTVNVSKSRYVKLRKASYCYNHKGKRVSKKLLKKGSIIRINGKVYRIKGKTYYHIANNRYVRVVNVAK
ncbi:SLAP domain-containing protein [Lactobacillus sp.]|uniref:SLAP domain-containing protein n=1 Tax=Lactobacillus sp. TaxID=1591 RepID=UPI0025EA8163|nr:SLAP domain-containing protein [Lactobacillus sp.]MCO6531837.1 SLAP domain-containing protein [Lactobacillus sp.]